jgi:hypothetical protein
MSDSAFKTGAYPAYTTAELRRWIVDGVDTDEALQRISTEVDRRERAEAGDVSAMTDGERLRYRRNQMIAAEDLGLTPSEARGLM